MLRKHTEALVGDLRTLTIPAVPERLSIAAARKVAALKHVSALFVERDGRLVGVLDERALAAAMEADEAATVMTAIDVCLHPAMPAVRARDLFIQSRVSILPVTFGALLIGAVARGDLERALAGPCKAAKRRVPRTRAAA
jgi:CBS domain-containing protein